MGSVLGMARRPFDPADEGWAKVELPAGGHSRSGRAWRRCSTESTSRCTLPLRSSASREETRKVNLEGTRNVFEAAIRAGVQRLGLRLLGCRLRLPPREPAAVDRGRSRPGQRELLLLGPEGRARGVARPAAAGKWGGGLRLPAVHRRRAAGDDADRADRRRGARRRSGAAAAPGVEKLPLVTPGPARSRRPGPARPPRRRRPGDGGGDLRRRPARRLQPRRRGRGPDRRHRPRARLALDPGSAPRRRPRHRGRPPSQLRLLEARVGERARTRRS